MGDRSNVVVVDESGGAVWFYSHWRGKSAFLRAQEAIAKRWRWGDASYLARIVYDAIVVGEEGSESGFGISTAPTSSEYPVLAIFLGPKKVAAYPQKDEHTLSGRFQEVSEGGTVLSGALSVATFEEFAGMDEEAVDAFMQGKPRPRADRKRLVVQIVVEGYGDEALPELERLVEQGLTRTAESELEGRSELFRLVGTTCGPEQDLGE